MAYFNIPENPEYIQEIRKFETTDPAHAKIFNIIIHTLINNIEFLKKKLTKMEKIEEITETDIIDWYTSDLEEQDNITNIDIEQMYTKNIDYEEGDLGIDNGEIEKMYMKEIDYKEGDLGIPNTEIDKIYL